MLIATTSLEPAYGGPARSASRLAAAMGEAGAEVGVWSADGSALTTPFMAGRPAGVRVLDGPAAAALQGFGPDVVHDNGLWLAHNHVIAAAAARAGRPRVVSPRGMLEPWARRHKGWKKAMAWALYQRRDLERACALHATGAPEAETLRGLGLGTPVVEIPNGMDLPPPRPGGVVVAGERTALFLGRIYPVKGLPMLVEAWARARPEGWRLVVAGPDEAGHLRQVQSAVARAGLGDKISFPGPVEGEAKRALLQGAELFVLPSHSESFGMAVAEALAHGIPVLTTTAAPWPQLEAKGCGWQTAPSPGPLAAALARATSCAPGTLRRMGAAGRALIAAEFGWPEVAARFLALYADLAGPTTRRAA